MRRVHRTVVITAVLLAGCGGTQTQERITDAETPRNLAVVVERMMPALERISGLDRIEEIRVRRQSREEARQYIVERLDHEMPAAEREALRRTYVAFGMLPDTLDLEALLLELYTEQVLGYYAPTRKTLFLVDGTDVDEVQVIAHELVHALQDQHTNLDSLVSRERGNDRQTAAHAAIEGHAMLVMTTLLAERATRRQLDPASLPPPAEDQGATAAAYEAEFPVFARAPRILRETLLFPYTQGAAFVHELWSARAPLPRYPAPFDSLLPQSTEQVISPTERFIIERDEPVPVELPEPPAGWNVLREDELGQLEMRILLAEHLGEDARSAADGWEGDRYALLATPSGDVIDWWSVWESPAHADSFAAAMRRTAERRPSRTISVTRSDHEGRATVRVIDAPRGSDISPLLEIR